MTDTMNAQGTWPRDCELAKGTKRLGYTNVERSHDAAFVEQDFRDGRITADEFAVRAREIEGKRYSTW